MPLELQAKFTLISEREALFDDLKRNLHKHRNMLIKFYHVKAKGKESTDSEQESLHHSDSHIHQSKQDLNQKVEKEYHRALSVIDDKISLDREVKQAIEQYLKALEQELSKVQSIAHTRKYL